MASTEYTREKEDPHAQSESLTENDCNANNEGDAKHDKVSVPGQDDAPPLDPRFNPPAPSLFKRAALILLTVILFWIAFNMRTSLWKKNHEAKVVYASRYSKEHKFRPAASPIVTETLNDGRVRIRGAPPTATPVQTPTPIPKKKKKSNRKKTRKGKVPGRKDRSTQAPK